MQCPKCQGLMVFDRDYPTRPGIGSAYRCYNCGKVVLSSIGSTIEEDRKKKVGTRRFNKTERKRICKLEGCEDIIAQNAKDFCSVEHLSLFKKTNRATCMLKGCDNKCSRARQKYCSNPCRFKASLLRLRNKEVKNKAKAIVVKEAKLRREDIYRKFAKEN